MNKSKSNPQDSHNPFPQNEESRLAILKGYHIMDTLPEKQFDDITRLASLICGTPITLISLLDEGRQWFKSKQGLEVTETPREISFCQFTILGDDIFEVPNSLEDERFRNNPLVTSDPNIRFYAGAPLIASEGNNIGTLCVIDTKPNKLNDTQREALTILASEVVINLELRKERERIDYERKKAFESSELLNAFLEHSPSYISLRDAKDGHYLMANQASLDNLKTTNDELIGKTLEELFDKDVVDKVLKDDREVIKSRKAATMEYELGDEGKKQIFLRHLFPVLDSEGNIYAVGAISNDITLSKKLEHEFRLSSDRFSSIFYNSPVCLLISDLQTSEFIMVNNTFIHTFGYEASEVVGKSVDDISFIESNEDRIRVRKELLEKGKLNNYEMTVLKKNGDRFVSLSSVEIVTVGGRPQVISAFQDITERKKMEVKLEEAKKEAEASTLSKSTFLANMSHEIRTPLNAMLGFATILADTKLDNTQSEYLEAIDSSGKNLLSIINDILDFSKIESGMFSIEKTPFSLQQALHSVNTMFFEKAQAKKLKFFTSIDPRTPTLVDGDPTRFTQIMINLIGNAIKFTNKGSVSIECVVEELSEKAVTIRIAVSDTGIGIASEKLESIFNRFTQAQDDTTRNFGGTGLGLSIARKLVELQDGELWVESNPGQGSEFTFRISYAISESQEYTHSENNQKNFTQKETFLGKRIMVVEDNILNQKLASTILTNQGFEVHLANNGQIAVEKLQTEQYDLILMDIQMPIMDGYQATKKLREELSISTPVIAMTANALAGERERCISFGMNDYITKPFKTQELLSKIQKLMVVS